MTNFAEMGKVELRAACKAAGISYGKLNNDGMRAALEAAAKTELTREAVIEMAKKMDITKLDHTGVEGHCPKCGINLENGWCDYESMCDTNKTAAGKMVHEYVCLACLGEFGPVIKRSEKRVDSHTGTGLKIEKNREKRNGVTRPSAGGKCAEVWEYLDSVYFDESDGKGKVVPTAKQVKEASEELGWNPNNASIEFYQWRKFMGLTGRK